MEAIATYRAVTFAKEIRHNSIVLDGDSTAFIDSLKNDEISLADYGHLIEVAKDIVGSFAIWGFLLLKDRTILLHIRLLDMLEILKGGWRMFLLT